MIASVPPRDLQTRAMLALWNEFGLISTLVMEISWMVPWYMANVPGRPWMNSIVMLFVFSIFALTLSYTLRYLRHSIGSPPIQYGIALLFLLIILIWLLPNTVFQDAAVGLGDLVSNTLASFAGGDGRVPTSLILIIISMYAWWRGISLSNVTQLDFYVTRRKLRLGLVFLGLFGVLHGMSNNRYLIQMTPWFFISGLLAISLSRTYRLSQRQAAFKLPFSGRWFLGIVLITAFLLLGGGLVNMMLRTKPAAQLVEILGDLLIRGIQVLFLIISPLFLWIIPLVERLAGRLVNSADLVPEDAGPDAEIGEPLFDYQEGEGFGGIVLSQEAIILLVLLLILIVIFFILRRSRKKRLQSPADFGDYGEQIRRRRGVFRRFAGQVREGIESMRAFGIGRQMIGAAMIRRTYGQLLQLADEIGSPRNAYETPSEFQLRLNVLFPIHFDEIALITSAYNQIRYGEFPEEEKVVSSVRAAWLSIHNHAIGKPSSTSA